jgi:hypothetical protein
MKLSLHGGALGCNGVVATVLITGSRASIGVRRPDVPLDFISPWVRGHRHLDEKLCASFVCVLRGVRVFRRAITVVWTTTPLMSTVMHDPWHRHLYRPCTMTVGSPRLWRCHPFAGSVEAVLCPRHRATPVASSQHSEELLVGEYISQSVAALKVADANTDEEGSSSTSKSVVLFGPSSIGLAKGRKQCELSVGLTMLKALLLKVVPMHGLQRFGSSLLKTNTCTEQACPYAMCFPGGRIMVHPCRHQPVRLTKVHRSGMVAPIKHPHRCRRIRLVKQGVLDLLSCQADPHTSRSDTLASSEFLISVCVVKWRDISISLSLSLYNIIGSPICSCYQGHMYSRSGCLPCFRLSIVSRSRFGAAKLQ